MNDIKSYTYDALKAFFISKGYPRFCAHQVFSWIYQKRVEDFDAMSDLSKAARGFLKETFCFSALELAGRQESKDGTQKFLFKLQDGNCVESVVIPERKRTTLCLSTQVGCRFGCTFCHSGRDSFVRNLTMSEIVNQYLVAEKRYATMPITHIVFMGIGEPLDNFDNTVDAIGLLTLPEGVGMSSQKISVSTCGLIPELKRLAALQLKIKLSVSLHSADEEVRTRLMPINKQYPLACLIPVLKEISAQSKAPISFEYVLLPGVNTRDEDVTKLVKLLHGMKYKINVIALHTEAGLGVQTFEIARFKEQLKRKGVLCTFRRSRGQDIAAACGQLRIQALKGL